MALQIMCVMRVQPNPDGHGGSQRAWHLLNALCRLGDVHFTLLFRDIDADCAEDRSSTFAHLVASITRVNMSGGVPSSSPKFGIIPGGIWDTLTYGNQEAPRVSHAELTKIAARLPVTSPDIIFAGRLSASVIIQSLLKRRLVSAKVLLVDFDDIMSKVARRHLDASGGTMRFRRRIRTSIDSRLLARAEGAIADSWHGVSVCSDEDVNELKGRHSKCEVIKVPNVVLRDELPPRQSDGRFNILFTGHLGFGPNIEGLVVFVNTVFLSFKEEYTNSVLTVAGLNPAPAVRDLAKAHGLNLHANVHSMEPFYRDCDVVIAPITFGGGTRIKIIEAMAYGRPVVSTAIGAEGLGLTSEKHILIVDTVEEFGPALRRLRHEKDLAPRLTSEARAYQQRCYTPAAVDKAVRLLLEEGTSRAAGHR